MTARLEIVYEPHSVNGIVEIVDPFAVAYRGRAADRGELPGEALAQSIAGASKLYAIAVHYVVLGTIPPPRGRHKKHFTAFARAATHGSWEQYWFIAPIVGGNYAVYGGLFKGTISYLFQQTLKAVVKSLTKPRESARMAEDFAKAVLDQNAQLASGLIRANEDQAKSHRRLIETLPQIVTASRPPARDFVAPIGDGCSKIVQSYRGGDILTIAGPDAEAIRGDEESEVDDMREYKVTRISEINVHTGHCIVAVEGIPDPVHGRIDDPVLARANNPYTRALNDQSACTVMAKAVRRAGRIQKLFISDGRIL